MFLIIVSKQMLNSNYFLYNSFISFTTKTFPLQSFYKTPKPLITLKMPLQSIPLYLFPHSILPTIALIPHKPTNQYLIILTYLGACLGLGITPEFWGFKRFGCSMCRVCSLWLGVLESIEMLHRIGDAWNRALGESLGELWKNDAYAISGLVSNHRYS